MDWIKYRYLYEIFRENKTYFIIQIYIAIND